MLMSQALVHGTLQYTPENALGWALVANLGRYANVCWKPSYSMSVTLDMCS